MTLSERTRVVSATFAPHGYRCSPDQRGPSVLRIPGARLIRQVPIIQAEIHLKASELGGLLHRFGDNTAKAPRKHGDLYSYKQFYLPNCHVESFSVL